MPDPVKVAQARDTLKAQRPGAMAEERAIRQADGTTGATAAAYQGVAGPAGAAGAAGTTGPTGPQGSTGPTKS